MKAKNTIFVSLLVLALAIGVTLYFVMNKSVKNTDTDNVTATIPSSLVTSKIYYGNTKYGFVVNLPESWKGFISIENNWTGMSLAPKDGNNSISEIGPIILIRHPLWTEAKPRQDIPVMVFTIKQWNDMQSDVFHIGAAPINPSELDRNAKYVFALPARYNFAYQTGFEEVDVIARGNNLKAF